MKKPKKVKKNQAQVEEVFNNIERFTIELDPIDYDIKLVDHDYDNIMIVGPHRSGTTFVAKAIAHDLKYRFVDEIKFSTPNAGAYRNQLRHKHQVIQSPSATKHIHTVAGDNDLVIFMVRNWKDIVKSVHRKNNFISNWVDLNYIYEHYKSQYLSYDPNCKSVIEETVNKESYYLNFIYTVWKYYQREKIPNYLELNYESFANHSLWVDKTQRTHFSAKQTTVKKKVK